MSRYSAQISICFIPCTFQFSIPLWVWFGTLQNSHNFLTIYLDQKFDSCKTCVWVFFRQLGMKILKYENRMLILGQNYTFCAPNVVNFSVSSVKMCGNAWGMNFNAKKCQIITFAWGRRPFVHFYTLCNHILESVSHANYLGKLVSNNLFWSPHINLVFNWANFTLGFLRRNLLRCPAPLRETAYITLMNVFHNGVCISSKWILEPMPVSLMELGLKDLKDRGRDLRLALLFKVVQGHVGVSPEDIGLRLADEQNPANHEHKFRTVGTRTNSYKYSFASRTIGD